MIKFKSFLLIGFFLGMSCLVNAQTPDTPDKCKVPAGTKGKYKTISAGKSLPPESITGLRVFVAPKYFTRDKMTEIVAKLKSEYCHEEHLSVVFFDDADVARISRVVVDKLVGNSKVPEIRGFYSLNRETGKESLSFSTKRGNATDEIQIDF